MGYPPRLAGVFACGPGQLPGREAGCLFCFRGGMARNTRILCESDSTEGLSKATPNLEGFAKLAIRTVVVGISIALLGYALLVTAWMVPTQ